MNRVLAVMALLLAAPLVVSAQAIDLVSGGSGRARDEEAIRNVLADFIDAWNRHDAKAFSMVFAEDADFTNVSGVSAHGRSEVEAFHAPRFATKFKDTRQRITEVKIRFIRDDVAAVDARWEMTGAKAPDGRDVPRRKGLLNFVMTRQGERWLITVMHNTELPRRGNDPRARRG
jgi:uncharacterized protein (TIGR02246 family)